MNGVVADLQMEVPAHAAEVAAVRHAVVACLQARRVPSVIVDDLELVVSELVTNAILHASPDPGDAVGIELNVGDPIELVVSDHGPADAVPPVERWSIGPRSVSDGRGLGIVRRLCDEVVVEQHGERTVIVCRRRSPEAGPA